MTTSLAVVHVHGQQPAEVERALIEIFLREERPLALRIEGTYSAVLKRATDPDLDAAYRYLVLRPNPAASWTPMLELGNRTIGLDIELSRALAGCPVVTSFVYGDVVSGYRVARAGVLVDRYTSDPTYFLPEAAGGDEDAAGDVPLPLDVDEERGHPERFADLLPPGTAPEDFARVVLRPGWWEEQDAAVTGQPVEDAGDDIVDEVDRMRCIGLAFELWGPSEYPFAAEPEDIPNRVAGPAIAIAFK